MPQGRRSHSSITAICRVAVSAGPIFDPSSEQPSWLSRGEDAAMAASASARARHVGLRTRAPVRLGLDSRQAAAADGTGSPGCTGSPRCACRAAAPVNDLYHLPSAAALYTRRWSRRCARFRSLPLCSARPRPAARSSPSRSRSPRSRSRVAGSRPTRAAIAASSPRESQLGCLSSGSKIGRAYGPDRQIAVWNCGNALPGADVGAMI